MLYHGGTPGLQVGDTITPGHTRTGHDDCPLCQLHAQHSQADPDYTQHPEHVYCTTYQLQARLYAALADGDLYEVKPDGCDLLPGDPDSPDCERRCTRLRVARIVDRHVRLTWKERRQYQRWMQRQGKAYPLDWLPRNATPAMIAKWQNATIAASMSAVETAGIA